LFAGADPSAFIKLNFGHINLTSSTLQPDGTSLGAITVPATGYTYAGRTPDDMLWKCDKHVYDQGEVYFLVATNADSRYGGYHEIAEGGIHGTAFTHVGLRTSMHGVPLARHWKIIPVREYDLVEELDPASGKLKQRIVIRVRHVPDLQAELVKVGQTVPNIGPDFGCYPLSPTAARPRIPYSCMEPNAYLQLRGPGLLHDEVGEDSGTKYKFWPLNGLTYALYNSVTLSRKASCVVHNATPHVRFDTVSVQQLAQAGVEGAASANFSIEVDCNGGITIAGTGENKTAIGIQVSPGAFAAAQKLGLVSGGGVAYLLSDQYGTDPGLAQGVGITVHDDRGQQRLFVGQPGTVGSGHPRGSGAGWYPVLPGTKQINNFPTGIRRHRLDFTAKLVRLPEANLTPGKIRASAHVLVKVQ